MAGVTRTYLGYAHGRSIVELRVRWTMSRSLDCEWSDPEGYWIEIEGEPRVEAAISFLPPVTPGTSDEPDVMGVLLVGTAMAAVNADALCLRGRAGPYDAGAFAGIRRSAHGRVGRFGHVSGARGLSIRRGPQNGTERLLGSAIRA